jgi:hypothetical protein
MSVGDQSGHDEVEAAVSREGRLEVLAGSLGIELPLFEGPLTAFVMGDEQGPGDPIYLGGDLHAVHPEATGRFPDRERDRSLDAATVVIDDQLGAGVETTAAEGIWCLALRAELLDSALYFMLWDTEGRTRAWLVIPPPRQMIGAGDLWLPSVPPPSGLAGITDRPADRPPPGL